MIMRQQQQKQQLIRFQHHAHSRRRRILSFFPSILVVVWLLLADTINNIVLVKATSSSEFPSSSSNNNNKVRSGGPSPLSSSSSSVVDNKEELAVVPSSTQNHQKQQQQQQQEKNFGFLDDNGTNVARLVEITTTTTLGDGHHHHQHQISLKDSKRQRRNKVGRKSNYHIKASILTVAMGIVWSPLLSSSLSSSSLVKDLVTSTSGSALDDPITTTAAAMNIILPTIRWIRIIVTFLYLLECLMSSTRRYLSNSVSPHQWKEYINSLKQARPVVVWELECYHYSHVWRQRRHENGRHTSSQTTSREKVVTHRARQEIPITNWKDVTSLDALERAIEMRGSSNKDKVFAPSSSSNDDDNYSSNIITFLKTTISKLFVFTNPRMGGQYLREETLFKEREGRYDIHYDFHRYIMLEGFRHKLLIVRTGIADVAMASLWGFWLMSLIGLTLKWILITITNIQRTCASKEAPNVVFTISLG